MPKRITNVSKQLLVVPLNSGETIHLAPGETSAAPVEDYELDSNEDVEKMRRTNLLAFDSPESAHEPLALLPPADESGQTQAAGKRRPAREA